MFEAANEGAFTFADAKRYLGIVVDAVVAARNDLIETFDARGKKLLSDAQAVVDRMRGEHSELKRKIENAKKAAEKAEKQFKRIDEVRSELTGRIRDVMALIPTMPDEYDDEELKRRLAVLEGKAPITPEDVRDMLMKLAGDERLDAAFIKNLPDYAKEVMRSVGGVHALGALADVSIAGITSGQSIRFNGIFWEPFTPSGSTGTPVNDEDLTTQNPTGSSFTLAHTPVSGTLSLYRGGSYQSVANSDYTIAGANITLSTALTDGEKLVASYSY